MDELEIVREYCLKHGQPMSITTIVSGGKEIVYTNYLVAIPNPDSNEKVDNKGTPVNQ